MVAFWAVGRRPRFLLLLATRRGFAPALVLLPATADQTSVFHVATQSIGSPRPILACAVQNGRRANLNSLANCADAGTSSSAPENAFADALGRNIGKAAVTQKNRFFLA